MRYLIIAIASIFTISCNSKNPDQEKAEKAAIEYLNTNYKNTVILSDTATFTPIKKMEGYSNGERQPLFYKFYYNAQVKDSTGTTAKELEIKLDSTLKVTEVIIPQDPEMISY